MKILYGLIKFLIGFILALTILAGGSVAAALYFVTRLTELPPRPVFENEPPIAASGTPAAKQNTQGNSNSLPPGAYRARVTWPDGLILRDRASYDANSIGGIEVNRNVIVLEVTSDKEWERVRVEDSNQEGWVKGGNTEKI